MLTPDNPMDLILRIETDTSDLICKKGGAA